MTNNTKPYIRELTQIAVFVSVICILAQIAIPISIIPITFQAFAIALCGYTLGKKKSLIATCIYLLLGAVGAPVFASFRGGFYVLLSYTGGFLWGFIPFVFLCALVRQNKVGIILGIMGVFLCHIVGIIQYSLVAQINIWQAFIVASLPFILKDIILTISAFFIAGKINKTIKAS